MRSTTSGIDGWVSDQLLACGGQHGELYITNRSDSPTSPNSRLKARFTSSATPIKQFSLCLTLPTRSINNSLVILPGWPEEWRRHEEERRLGFAGRESRQWDEGERADDFGEEVEEEDETSDGMREDADSLTNEDELGEDEIYSAPGSGSSIATYPNTVPFIHAPRISRLPNTSSLSLELPTTSRRTDSFRAHNQLLHSTREISTRNSSSSFSQTPGQPPIQYVTSRSPSNRPSSRSRRNIEGSRRPPPLRSRDEPRLLISNNDQTVKLFSLRSITPAEPSPDVTRDPSLWDSRISRVPAHPLLSASRQVSNQSGRITERRPQVGAPLSRFGSGAGREAVGHHEGILPAAPDHEEPPWDLARAYREWQILLEEREASNREREVLSREREVLDRERAELDEFERVVGISVRPSRSALGSRPREGPSCPPVMQTSEKKEVREERKLTKVGGARFKYAINHCTC